METEYLSFGRQIGQVGPVLSWNDGVNRAKCIDRRSCLSFIIFFSPPSAGRPDSSLLSDSHLQFHTRVPNNGVSFPFAFRAFCGVEIDSYGCFRTLGLKTRRGDARDDTRKISLVSREIIRSSNEAHAWKTEF